jgi:hypothetical protein
MTQEKLLQCFKTLKFTIGGKEREKLMNLSPEKYTGYAEEIIDMYIK